MLAGGGQEMHGSPQLAALTSDFKKNNPIKKEKRIKALRNKLFFMLFNFNFIFLKMLFLGCGYFGFKDV